MHACSVSQSYPTLCDSMYCKPQALLSMGFPRQEYWSELPFTSSRRFSQLEDQTQSPGLAGGFFTTESSGKPEEDLSMMLENSIFLNIY